MSPLATLFVHPRDLSSAAVWMVIPVAVAVAAVYKTLRTRSPRRLPLEIVLLSAYILAGMGALIAALWLLQRFWVE